MNAANAAMPRNFRLLFAMKGFPEKQLGITAVA